MHAREGRGLHACSVWICRCLGPAICFISPQDCGFACTVKYNERCQHSIDFWNLTINFLVSFNYSEPEICVCPPSPLNGETTCPYPGFTAHHTCNSGYLLAPEIDSSQWCSPYSSTPWQPTANITCVRGMKVYQCTIFKTVHKLLTVNPS